MIEILVKRPKLELVGTTLDPKTGKCRQVFAPKSGIYLLNKVAVDFNELERMDDWQETLDELVDLIREMNKRKRESVKRVKDNRTLPHAKLELRLPKKNTEEPWRRKPEGSKRRGRG